MKTREGLSSFSVTKEKRLQVNKEEKRFKRKKEGNNKIARQCKASSPSHVGGK